MTDHSKTAQRILDGSIIMTGNPEAQEMCRDYLRDGLAVTAALTQAIKSMDEHRCGFGTCHVCVSMKACKAVLATSTAELSSQIQR